MPCLAKSQGVAAMAAASLIFVDELAIPSAALLGTFTLTPPTLKISSAILGFAVLWFTYMWAAPRFSSRRQFRRTPSAQTPITIAASDAGLHILSAHADSQVAWTAYVAWGATTPSS